jgi:DnaJ-class molecular chaperone
MMTTQTTFPTETAFHHAFPQDQNVDAYWQDCKTCQGDGHVHSHYAADAYNYAACDDCDGHGGHEGQWGCGGCERGDFGGNVSAYCPDCDEVMPAIFVKAA